MKAPFFQEKIDKRKRYIGLVPWLSAGLKEWRLVFEDSGEK